MNVHPVAAGGRISALDEPAAIPARLASEPARLDILTPALNAERWIRAAIASIRTSRLEGVRHVVIDGGSTDATVRICRLAGVDVIEVPGSDSHEAMNVGLRATSAPFVGFLNADDAYVEDPLPVAVEALADSKSGLAVFDCVICDPHGRIDGYLTHAENDDRAVELMFGVPGFNGHFFARRALEALGGFDISFRVAADRDLLLRAEIMGLGSKLLRRIGYAYRSHDGSRTLDQAARLAEQILSDHQRLAVRIAADPSLPSRIRSLAADWKGHEAWHAALRHLSLGSAAAKAAMLPGLITDPGLRNALAALSGRRRVARVRRQLEARFQRK